MANQNPLGSSKFWYDGSVAQVIDNSVNGLLDAYIGTTDFTYQGRAEGYLQGGAGSVGDTPQNLSMDTTLFPQPTAFSTVQAVVI
jgi:hypothetical protein